MKLPEGWKEVELGDICEIVSGSTPDTTKEEYWNGDIHWITPAEIKNGHNWYYYDTKKKITKKGLDSSSINLFPKGTVMLTSRAPIGKVAIAGVEMCSNQGFKNFICDCKKIIPEYLYFWLRSKEEYLNSIGRGATFKEISKTIVSKVKIPLPSISIQKKIIEKLEKTENIKQFRSEADKLTKKYLQSIFYEMFGDPIKNEKKWPTQKGLTLFKFSSGKFNPTFKLDDSYEFAAFGGNGITGHSKEYLIDFKTLVIGRVGAYCGSIHKTPQKCWITDNAIYIKEFKEKINLEFLYYLFTFLNINRFALTVGQPKITQGPLDELDYIIPPLPLQQKFANIVEQVEKIKEQQKESKKEIDKMFDSLVSKAFKGELVI